MRKPTSRWPKGPDLAIQIMVGAIVIMAAILVGALLSARINQ